MNILVISQSSIVIELLKLIFKDESINSEHIKSVDSASSDSYDIIFVDDSIYDLDEEIEDIKDNISYKKLVLIGSSDIDNEFDIVVKKPFLPKDIEEILDDIDEIEDSSDAGTNVLDINEIEKIKELMNMDDEDDIEDIIDRLNRREDIKLKGKDAKEFLYECRGLTKKELKKLLKGAKIKINIKFKKSIYE